MSYKPVYGVELHNYTSSHTCSEWWSPLLYPQGCELRKTVQSLCWYTSEKIVIEHQNLQIGVDREVTGEEGGEAVTRHYPAGEERRRFHIIIEGLNFTNYMLQTLVQPSFNC